MDLMLIRKFSKLAAGRALLFLALLVPGVDALSGELDEESPLPDNLLNRIYQPLHTEFAESARQWASNVTDLCQRRPASSVYKMQQRFAGLVENYAAIEFFRIGPMLDNNIQNRIFYWPDKRRVAQRQLQALVSSMDAAPVSVAALAGKSVAVQGFPALERLLYKPEFQPIEISPQCELIPAIVENIATMAAELEAGWQSDTEFVKALLVPNAESAYFRSSEEVLRSVFTQAKVGLDVVLEGKLKPLLSNDSRTMQQTPLWVSQRTVAMLTGNLKGLRALLLDSGMLHGTRFDETLRIEFEYIDHVLSELKPIVYFVELDGSLKSEVKVLMHKLAAVVAGIRFTLIRSVSNTLGITAGFNSEDGD